ncbi:MAG: iron-sulfur cluster assembly accessory protein [Gammaproteobacteria bacterium]|nr:iron-sulfur cluster assembly accessory protein [Gammaproteobacteria bacterium]
MSITLTPRAAEHVRQFLAKSNDGIGLRLSVRAAGCSGHAYQVETATRIGADDQVFDCHDVKVVVDKLSLPLLEGITVDYTREGFNEGFRFDNPNVRGTCGCGESFNV